MSNLRRAGRAAGWTAGFAVYLWFAAVGNADRAKARKAARRRTRRLTSSRTGR